MANVKDQKYSKTLCLRLSPEIQERLQAEADRLGCTVSQAARMVLKRRTDPAPVQSMTGPETNRRLVLAAKGTRNEFRKIAGDYHTFVTLFRDWCARDGESRPEGMLHAVDALSALTLRLQDSVDALLTSLDRNLVEGDGAEEAEDCPPAAVSSEANIKELEIEYCYMEDITIMGTVGSAVSFFTSNRGTEGMRFTVTVLAPNGKRTDYVVIKERNNVADYLNFGRQVVVTGELSVDFEKKELLVRADRIKLTSIQ